VHAAYVSADIDTSPYGRGLRAIAHGFAYVYGKDDQRKIELETPMYDAFYAVFASAEPAIGAAVAAQRTLQAELPQIRVRMAIHVGDVELSDGHYFGWKLERAFGVRAFTTTRASGTFGLASAEPTRPQSLFRGSSPWAESWAPSRSSQSPAPGRPSSA